jgi:hypothetical protein
LQSGQPSTLKKEQDHHMKIRFRFEKLEVWQEGRALNREVYRLTRRFPDHERFAMTSQIKTSKTPFKRQ